MNIKRAYFKRIDDYSSDELGKIFQSHISPEAKVKTINGQDINR